MRKSLQTVKHMIQDNNYPNLPPELKEYYAYLKDSGHSIMAIPKVLLSKYSESDLWELECAIPVKFVLSNVFYLYDGHIIIDASYDDTFGIEIDESYYEY